MSSVTYVSTEPVRQERRPQTKLVFGRRSVMSEQLTDGREALRQQDVASQRPGQLVVPTGAVMGVIVTMSVVLEAPARIPM